MAIIKGAINPVISGTTTFPESKAIQVTAPNRHSVRPSLVLDFANSRTLDPRINFTRVTSATYYDGTTTVSEQNLMGYSQDVNYWSGINVSAGLNSTTAPDGTNTAVKVIPSTTNDRHIYYYYMTGAASFSKRAHVFSVFFKAAGLNYAQLGVFSDSSGANSGCIVDLTNGTITNSFTTSAYGTNTFGVTSFGNGWYRAYVYLSSAAYNSGIGIIVAPSNSATPSYTAGSPLFAGDANNGIHVWGAQAEVDRFTPTSYVNTSTTGKGVTSYVPVMKLAGPNQPRFDIDPVTLESKGLLLEDSRTNYAPNLDSGSWGAGGNIARTQYYGIAPDGSQSAIRLANSGTTNPVYYIGTVSGTSAAYTFSVYAKKDPASSNTKVGIRVDYPGYSKSGIFDVVSGTVVSAGTDVDATATTLYAGNGWYRCSITMPTSSSLTNAVLQTDTTSSTASAMFWGPQVEAAPIASSYIPTTSGTVTRGADTPVISGANFSSWYRQDQGTFYSEVYDKVPTAGTAATILSVLDPVNYNEYGLRYNNTGLSNWYMYTYGAYTMNITDTVARTKMAVGYNTAGISFYGDGASIGTNTLNAVTNMAYMVLGKDWPGSNYYLNGHIKKISYYPVRLSNAEIQSLTTA